MATPGLTALHDASKARSVLLDDALLAASVVGAATGTIVDIGSGGGSPGVPLAVAFPSREFVLLEAERRKAAFLERVTADRPNIRVIWGRAEEQPVELYGVALAKAVAEPPVAVELCLPLMPVGGSAVLWVGPSVDRDRVERAAGLLGGELSTTAPHGLLVVRKVAATPKGFPRRPGMAKKRPLA